MATKVAYRIEVVGNQASLQKLRPIAEELATIGDRIDELNEGFDSLLKDAGKRFAALIKQIKEANAAAAGISLPGRPTGTNPQPASRPTSGSGTGSAPAPSSQPEAESLTKELRRLLREAKDRVGETGEEYDRLISRVAELKVGQKQVTDEIKSQQRTLESKSFSPGSYKAIQAEVGRLANQWRELGEEQRESLEGRSLQQAIDSQRDKLKKLDKQIGINVRNVGNYRDSIRGLQSAFLTLASINVAGVGAREILEENAKISDSISDVRKTTQLGAKTIEGYQDTIIGLSEELKGLDTRTGLADLLDISRVGGQLGIVSEFVDEFKRLDELGDTEGAAEQLEKAQEGLLGFTRVVDEVVVSLGEDLPGGVDQIARDFGRLNSLLGAKQEFGAEQGIRVMASAVNSLGASGEATEAQIVDFSKRLAGLAGQANLSAGDLFGFAATFDEIGLSSEVTATSFTQFVLSMGKNVETFADLAGVKVGDFRELLETDVNEAVLTLLDNLNLEAGDVEGVERLQKILEPLGIDGARAAQAIGGLAGNTELLRKRQEISNREFAIARGEIEGTLSVTAEFEEKNNNLAATLDKVRNAMINSLSSPEIREGVSELAEEIVDIIPPATRFISGLVSGGIAITKFFIEAFKVVKDFGLALGFLAAVTLIYSKDLRLKLLLQAKDIFQMGVLSKVTKAYTIVQRALNLALKANPIGIVISLIAFLIVGIGKLQERYAGLRDKISEVFIKLDNFLKLLGPFGVFFRATLLAIRAAIDAVSDYGSAFAGLKAIVSTAISNISGFFTRIVNQAKIAGLELKQALTFNDAKDAALESQIDALKAANEELRSSDKGLAEVYEEAFKANQARKALLDAQKKETESAQSLASLPGRGGVSSTGDPSDNGSGDAPADGRDPAGDGAADGKSYGKSRREAELEEERKLAEERARDRLAAAEKLRDLETALIKDSFQRQIKETENQASDDIGSLVGDPEQIEQQADLIREKLTRELEQLFTERSETINTEVTASIETIGNTQGLLPTSEQISEAGDKANAALIQRNEELLTLYRERLEAQDLLESEVAEKTEAFRTEMLKKETSQIAENNSLILSLQVQSLDQRRELEEADEEVRLERRLNAIREGVAAGRIAEQEAEELIKEAKAEEELLRLDAERVYWEERAKIAQEGSLEYLRIQAELNANAVEQDTVASERRIESEKKLQEQRRKASDIALSIASDFVSEFSELLDEDEERRKEYAGAIKALALGEIAINLYREIASINSNPTINALPPGISTVVKVASIGAAVAKSIVQANKVRQQEFAEGGEVPGSNKGPKPKTKPTREARKPGSNSPKVLEPGYIFGAAHADGGVSFGLPSGEVINAEGAERYIQNGDEGYIVNKRSSRAFSGELNALQQSSTAFSEEKREAVSNINSFKGWGRSFSQGGPVFSSSITAPLRRQPITPSALLAERAQNSMMIEELKKQNGSLQKGLQAVASSFERNRQTVVNNNNNPAEIVRSGLNELNKRENGITS